MNDLPLDSADLTWLAGLARALLGEPHAADDLVQETAVAALEGPVPSGAPRRAWLGAVARRLAARRYRGEVRRERREELAARSESLPDSAELVARAEIAEHVAAAARTLPEPYRRTILLRFLEGRTPEEIAREEGKPADTVRWRVRRGLELLREELTREHDRDWSSWSVLLIPLARSRGDLGVATAVAPGVLSGLVASLMVMKTTIAVIAALGCAGLWLVWESVDGGTGETLAVGNSVTTEVAPQRPTSELAPGAPAGATPTRTEVTASSPTEEAVVEVGSVTGDLLGQVVDESGKAISGAKVYLIPSVSAERGEPAGGSVRTQTKSDRRGNFRIAQESWMTGEAVDEQALDLGVAANGYRRQFVPSVTTTRTREELLVVLERGRTLSGRVIDDLGRPVPDLELLAYTAYAGIAHVSPSQRLLRAQRRDLANAASTYDQCRATTGGRGEITFAGLPTEDLQILSLDPGWTIEGPGVVDETTSSVEWTAMRRLGVRLIVIDNRTGQPVERAAATFRFELTFADGEVRDFGQWVGRGSGEVSFVLGGEILPGLEKRTVARAAFYGTVRSGDAEKVNWVAEAIEDPAGVVGVAEVCVEVDTVTATLAAADTNEPEPLEEAGSTTLELDVRYEDATPFEGELRVSWASPDGSARKGNDRAKAVGVGRYRLEVPAGNLALEVSDRFGSGSLSPWTDEVQAYPDRALLAFVTLPRGSTATIERPRGWGGEWFVHASWRRRDTEAWQGSLGYSTDESSLTLTVLQPGEWRFELRRESSLERDPLVRTVLLAENESVVVDE